MPGGQPLRLGPFIGGLNTASDPTAIADAELAICSNFELDIDGSLISRPPMSELPGHASWTERIVCLGEAIFGGNSYLIGSNANGVFYYLSGSWTLITNTIRARVAVQYADNVYLIADPAATNPSGKWNPSSGFTAVAAMPKGSAAVIHKERLFVVPGVSATTNASRLTFSDPGNFEAWPAANFIDAGQGDGTTLVDLTIFQDNLLLFKQQSTYVLAYDVRPTDAVLRKISSTIGVDKQYNVVNYENQVYVMHDGWVYEIINYDFNRLNTKVPFIRDNTSPTPFAETDLFISRLEDRLICRFYRKVYVYGLRTRTWTEWESSSDVLQFFGPILTVHPLTGNVYYAGSALTAGRSLIKFVNDHTATDTELSLDPASYSTTDTFSRTVSGGWGTANTGESWNIVQGAAADFSVNGSVAIASMGSLNASRVASLPVLLKNIDMYLQVTPNVVATGASLVARIRARYVDLNTNYLLKISFTTTPAVVIELYSIQNGAAVSIGTSSTISSYAANDVYSVRFQIDGTTVRAKVWKSPGQEPNGWTVTATDSYAPLQVAGGIAMDSRFEAGGTNALPVTLGYDNFSIGNMDTAHRTITCKVRTKNFDMAVPHQFKRLWWWGADVTTNNVITGIATPIMVAFNVTWSALTSTAWNALKTWAQPTTSPSSVLTDSPTGTGTARRFAKFLKSLRFRQINFEVQLKTDGSLADGPARLFTMTIVTETKAGVSKGIS